MATAENLTASATKTLQAVSDLIVERGYSPTIREVCNRIGWASPNAAQRHLAFLRVNGLVTWSDYRPRTLCVTEQGNAFLGSLAEK